MESGVIRRYGYASVDGAVGLRHAIFAVKSQFSGHFHLFLLFASFFEAKKRQGKRPLAPHESSDPHTNSELCRLSSMFKTINDIIRRM